MKEAGRALGPAGAASVRPALRVGAPEREAARDALAEHRDAERIGPDEYTVRTRACQHARTQAELLQVFAGLPAPHPELPGPPQAPAPEDDFPPEGEPPASC